jgi:hypothetical protein
MYGEVTTMAIFNTEERDEITRQLAPWLRAKVEHGLLLVWLSEEAPDYIKEIYRNCYS